jgi:hypothetical protein
MILKKCICRAGPSLNEGRSSLVNVRYFGILPSTDNQRPTDRFLTKVVAPSQCESHSIMGSVLTRFAAILTVTAVSTATIVGRDCPHALFFDEVRKYAHSCALFLHKASFEVEY